LSDDALKEGICKSGNIRINSRFIDSACVSSKRNNTNDKGITCVIWGWSSEERTTTISLARILSNNTSSANLNIRDESSMDSFTSSEGLIRESYKEELI